LQQNLLKLSQHYCGFCSWHCAVESISSVIKARKKDNLKLFQCCLKLNLQMQPLSPAHVNTQHLRTYTVQLSDKNCHATDVTAAYTTPLMIT